MKGNIWLIQPGVDAFNKMPLIYFTATALRPVWIIIKPIHFILILPESFFVM